MYAKYITSSIKNLWSQFEINIDGKIQDTQIFYNIRISIWNTDCSKVANLKLCRFSFFIEIGENTNTFLEV